MAGAELIQLTDELFESEIEQHEGLAMVDFWATWCSPCQAIAPVIQQLAEEFDGQVKVAKLDVDANQETPMRFGVRSIPTILFFKGGQHVDTVVGAVPKQQLVSKLESHLAA